MFLFVLLGMYITLLQYQCRTELSVTVRPPLLEVEPKGVALGDSERHLPVKLVVLSGRYAIYFHCWFSLRSHPFQRSHPHVVYHVSRDRDAVSLS